MLLAPSSDLMNYTLPATATIDQADWIILASIRDSVDWFSSVWRSMTNGGFSRYSSIDDDGGTRPGLLEDWFEAVGYTDVQKNFSPDRRWLGVYSFWAEEASKLYQNGYKVCLMINAKMLKNPHESSNEPDHAVALTSPIRFNNVYTPPHEVCFYEGRHH